MMEFTRYLVVSVHGRLRYHCLLGMLCAAPMLAYAGQMGADKALLAEQAGAPEPVQLAALDNSALGFNVAFMQGMASAADIRSLLAGSGIPAGVQRADLYVNQLLAGRRDMEFSHNPKTGDVEPCFSLAVLQQMGVDIPKLPGAPVQEASCLRLAELIPEASTTYDGAHLRLNVSIPQIYMTPVRRGYVDPSLWDAGANVAFLDYNLSMRQDKHSGMSSSRDLSVGLRMGANFGDWRLRNDSYVTSGSHRRTEFISQNTYLQRGINGLKSQMVLGQTYTHSPLFDSVRFLGVQMASDDAMRPDDEQGYAPVIRGSAESNATVEVRQNGYLLYTTNVAPGPFEITDLSPSGSNGDLEITIIEADGSRRVLRQAFSSPPLMVREGRIKYDVAMGQLRLSERQENKPSFVSSSALYGLTANTTLAAGIQGTPGFTAYSLGLGLNTSVGAFSVDGIHSRSNAGGQRISGDRVNLRYAKFVETTGSHVSVNAQHSLREGYRTLSDHVQANEDSLAVASRFRGQSSRQRIDASLSQSIGEGSFYLNGSYGKNWDKTSTRSLSLGYSNNIGRVAYNISYTHSRNLFSSSERSDSRNNAVMLTLSIPLGDGYRAPQGFVTMNRQNDGTTAQAGVTGLLPTEREISYAISGGRDANGQDNGSASLGATTSFGRMNANYSYGRQTRSGSFSTNGSIVAHGGGVNVGQGLGETFMLAKVDPPVPGVGIASFAGVETGYNGYAVIPSATPYRSNWIGLDAKGSSGNVDFPDAMQQVVPTRGAAIVATFKADVGRRVQFEFRQADDQAIPFGAIVNGRDGDRIGITDPRGRVLTMLPIEHERGELYVQWDGNSCRAAYVLPPQVTGENYQRLTLRCTDAVPPVKQDMPNAIASREPQTLLDAG